MRSVARGGAAVRLRSMHAARRVHGSGDELRSKGGAPCRPSTRFCSESPPFRLSPPAWRARGDGDALGIRRERMRRAAPLHGERRGACGEPPPRPVLAASVRGRAAIPILGVDDPLVRGTTRSDSGEISRRRKGEPLLRGERIGAPPPVRSGSAPDRRVRGICGRRTSSPTRCAKPAEERSRRISIPHAQTRMRWARGCLRPNRARRRTCARAVRCARSLSMTAPPARSAVGAGSSERRARRCAPTFVPQRAAEGSRPRKRRLSAARAPSVRRRAFFRLGDRRQDRPDRRWGARGALLGFAVLRDDGTGAPPARATKGRLVRRVGGRRAAAEPPPAGASGTNGRSSNVPSDGRRPAAGRRRGAGRGRACRPAPTLPPAVWRSPRAGWPSIAHRRASMGARRRRFGRRSTGA